ncbi:MAG: hypothetical protein HY518_04675 [Candidatus Aenigmarchaeota archaeon]|nr:hypothetical protein [Candidatus Aenigmarchaeota archaeon]
MGKALGIVGIIVLIIGLAVAGLYSSDQSYMIAGIVLVIIGIIIAAVGFKGKGSKTTAAMPAKT